MNYIDTYNLWLNSKGLDEKDRAELVLIGNDEKEIRERFYQDIEFGTAGMRGLLGVGTNRLNKYTVRKATKGYADYIKAKGSDAAKRGVVIAHDNRRQSVELSLETAGVLAANGIKSYLFDSLRPTPELSFAVRHIGAFGGVMITASHNPAEYNGYKLYDERGCQLVPSIIDELIGYVNAIADPLSVEVLSPEAAGELIEKLDSSVDESYYAAVESIVLRSDVNKDIKVVYSPQHGTGNIPVREVLSRLGYNVIPVLAQCVPDTEFSATKNPNPETKEAFELPLEYARKNDADIVITTDPDCDRLGVAVKGDGDYVLMTGNQSAAVLLDYILDQRKKKGILPENSVMFNTVVTSDLGDRICEAYGVDVEKTLTGFKFIGDKIYGHETVGDKVFAFGYEESYGCLVADFVRDKDAVQAALMLCECAAYYKEKGMTLIDALEELYKKHGYYYDKVNSFTFKGIDGVQKIKDLMSELRSCPPMKIGELSTVKIEDYTSSEMIEQGFPSSNVLKFIFDDTSWVAARPSGTEPKCKFYYCVCGVNKAVALEKFEQLRAVFEKNC